MNTELKPLKKTEETMKKTLKNLYQVSRRSKILKSHRVKDSENFAEPRSLVQLQYLPLIISQDFRKINLTAFYFIKKIHGRKLSNLFYSHDGID